MKKKITIEQEVDMCDVCETKVGINRCHLCKTYTCRECNRESTYFSHKYYYGASTICKNCWNSESEIVKIMKKTTNIL